jgi:hypothetical protein
VIGELGTNSHLVCAYTYSTNTTVDSAAKSTADMQMTHAYTVMYSTQRHQLRALTSLAG